MIGREGRTRGKECRRKKSMLRQRILGDGRGVEDRFWKYRRSNRPDSQMRVLLAACRELALDYDTFPTICFWT